MITRNAFISLVLVVSPAEAWAQRDGVRPCLGGNRCAEIEPESICPDVTIEVIRDTEEIVFDHSTMACNFVDCGSRLTFPDLACRAFIDTGGDIQLIFPTSGFGCQPNGNLRMVGDSFGNLELQDCVPDPFPDPDCVDSPGCADTSCIILNSSREGAPCDFNDLEWLAAVYREDDQIHAIVHQEGHRNLHEFDPLDPEPRECMLCEEEAPNCCNGIDEFLGFEIPKDAGRIRIWCSTTSLTYALSCDNGATYHQTDLNCTLAPEDPDLVATLPYQHILDSDPTSPDFPFCDDSVAETCDCPVTDVCPDALVPANGHAGPSNIVAGAHADRRDPYFYMIAKQSLPRRFIQDAMNAGCAREDLDWAMREHSILLRTLDLSDPSAWEAWDGTCDSQTGEPNFSVQFADPYGDPAPTLDPLDHVGYPLDPWYDDPLQPASEYTAVQYSDSLTWNACLGCYLLFGWRPVVNSDLQSGGDDKWAGYFSVFYSCSFDLVHWSDDRLVVDPEGLLANSVGNPIYPSLIDHESPSFGSPNFEVSSGQPYLYYLCEEGSKPTPPPTICESGPNKKVMDLWRVRLQIKQAGQPVACTPRAPVDR